MSPQNDLSAANAEAARRALELVAVDARARDVFSRSAAATGLTGVDALSALRLRAGAPEPQDSEADATARALLDDLRRTAFGRSETEPAAFDAREQLEELERRAHERDAALDAAVAAVLAAVPLSSEESSSGASATAAPERTAPAAPEGTATAAPVEPATAAPEGPADATSARPESLLAEGPPEDLADERPVPAPRRARFAAHPARWLAAAAVLGILAGIALTTGLGAARDSATRDSATREAAAPTPASTSNARDDELPATGEGVGAGLNASATSAGDTRAARAWLDTQQHTYDINKDFPGLISPGSTRLVQGDKNSTRVWVGSSSSGDLCLAVGLVDGLSFGSCASDFDFDREGLTVTSASAGTTNQASREPALSAHWNGAEVTLTLSRR